MASSPFAKRPRAIIAVDDPRAELVYTPSVRARLDETFELLPTATADTDVEVLFTGWGGPILDASQLAQLPSLKACFHAAGTVRRMIATDEFWRRDIVLSSAYHANAEPVAEFCHSLIILLLKGAFPAQQHNGFVPHGIYGATIGLVSYGTIARLLRAKLHSLHARVLVYDPFLSAAEAAAQGVEPMELPQLLATAQIVSLHTPLLPETHHLIGESQLRLLRRHTCLINTARGAIVDTDALVRVLAGQPDLFACLDVTDPEPLPADSPEEAQRYLHGHPLKWRISAEAAKRMA